MAAILQSRFIPMNLASRAIAASTTPAALPHSPVSPSGELRIQRMTAPTPRKKKRGLFSKVWGFVKRNLGSITGAILGSVLGPIPLLITGASTHYVGKVLKAVGLKKAANFFRNATGAMAVGALWRGGWYAYHKVGGIIEAGQGAARAAQAAGRSVMKHGGIALSRYGTQMMDCAELGVGP